MLQFVDADLNVREEFLGFGECKSGVTGEALGDTLLDTLQN